jgi:POT family proton-dependent oligopeptide transporter
MENDDLLEDKGIGPVDFEEGFRGHPPGLMTLFFSEMWERFCYYGMRTLLTLYLVKSLLMGDSDAALIYGAYTGLVYAAPILGGQMADKFLGYRYAVILGGILMAIGEFLIIGGGEKMLMIGMGALIIGNGYFKANISTIVGKLYRDNDPRRDSGFTIFYIGINVGALLATTVVAYVGETYGFHYGFGLAGIGMLLGILIFYSGRNKYKNAPGLEFTEAGKKKVLGPLNMIQAVTLGSLLLIPACYLLILNNSLIFWLLIILFVLIGIVLVIAGAKEDKAIIASNALDASSGTQGKAVWRDRMIVLLIFMVINVVFWAFFEQAGTSLTLFADRCVNRAIMGWTMPASMTQFFNPFFIIVFGSIFSVMWVKLSKIGKNPSIPMKFAYGIAQLGIGFLITIVGLQFVDSSFQVPLLTLVFLYLFHTTGELFLSPIGLSMVTKLAPKQIAGTAMGAWFLSFAMANYLGGFIASIMGSHGGGAELTGQEGLFSYTDTFATIGYILLAFALLIMVFNKPLKKLMHGVE